MGYLEKIIRCCILLCAGLGCVPAQGQATFSASLEKSSIQLGDSVVLMLRLSAPASSPLEALEFSALDTMAGLERLRSSAVEEVTTDSLLTYSQSMVLLGLDSGRFVIPSLLAKLASGEVLSSKPLYLVVVPPPLDEGASLAPVKDIIEEAARWTDYFPVWLLLLLALLLLAAGGWFWQKYRRKKSPLPAPPARSAAEIARAKLGRLQPAQAAASAAAKEAFYEELTYILREYMEGQWGFQALESTSRDIEHWLQQQAVCKPFVAPLAEMLQKADLIKFAQATPAVAPAEDYSLVADFVEKTALQGAAIAPRL